MGKECVIHLCIRLDEGVQRKKKNLALIYLPCYSWRCVQIPIMVLITMQKIYFAKRSGQFSLRLFSFNSRYCWSNTFVGCARHEISIQLLALHKVTKSISQTYNKIDQNYKSFYGRLTISRVKK